MLPGGLDERVRSAEESFLVDQLVAGECHNEIVASVVHYLSAHDYFTPGNKLEK